MSRLEPIAGKDRNISGWQKDMPDDRDKKMAVGFFTRLKHPSIKTLRTEPYISKVEDQDAIGSCTCNSSTSAQEMVLKKSGKDIQLSRLWPYAEVRKLEGTPLTEDSGAQIRNVMKVLAKKGCPLESEYPYDLSKWNKNPPKALEAEAAKNQILIYYRCPNLDQICASIAQGFAVVGGFRCPVSLFSAETAKTGIIKFDPIRGFRGGHAVLFTGYNDKTKLLEFQNSWSEDWGDKGYGYLPYQYVERGYADDFWTIRLAEV